MFLLAWLIAIFTASYNDEPFTEKTFELLKDLLDNLSDLYSISDMIIDNETYRRDARKHRRIVAG